MTGDDMRTAFGWAVMATIGDTIYVQTVSSSRRAAIVNWLMSEKDVMVYNYTDDDTIERMWEHFGNYVECRQVQITDIVGVQ